VDLRQSLGVEPAPADHRLVGQQDQPQPLLLEQAQPGNRIRQKLDLADGRQVVLLGDQRAVPV